LSALRPPGHEALQIIGKALRIGLLTRNYEKQVELDFMDLVCV
jgi:hypothetical protein